MDVSTPHDPDGPHDVNEPIGPEGLSETSDENLSDGEDEPTIPPESPEQSESEAKDEPPTKRRRVLIRPKGQRRVPLTEVTDSVGSVDQADAVEDDGAEEPKDPMDMDPESEGRSINDVEMKRVRELEGELSMGLEPSITHDANTELHINPADLYEWESHIPTGSPESVRRHLQPFYTETGGRPASRDSKRIQQRNEARLALATRLGIPSTEFYFSIDDMALRWEGMPGLEKDSERGLLGSIETHPPPPPPLTNCASYEDNTPTNNDASARDMGMSGDYLDDETRTKVLEKIRQVTLRSSDWISLESDLSGSMGMHKRVMTERMGVISDDLIRPLYYLRQMVEQGEVGEQGDRLESLRGAPMLLMRAIGTAPTRTLERLDMKSPLPAGMLFTIQERVNEEVSFMMGALWAVMAIVNESNVDFVWSVVKTPLAKLVQSPFVTAQLELEDEVRQVVDAALESTGDL
ncbi:hypothetical protein QQX98_007918 [Neonectria punicea]|uniref:Uncharacterized protein n=1 Tax=Neonectria punicea TaxID=979145 RepID=A0ABR1GX02_9HYPO